MNDEQVATNEGNASVLRPAAQPHAASTTHPREVVPWLGAEGRRYAWISPVEEESDDVAVALAISHQDQDVILSDVQRGPRTFELARFDLPSRVVLFNAVPQIGEVGYSEISTDDTELDSTQESPLERFLSISPERAPVPQTLVDLDERSEDESVRARLRHRDIVSTTGDMVVQGHTVDDLALPPSTQRAAPMNYFCGPEGKERFENGKCSGDFKAHCDSGIWYHLTRSSGDFKSRISYSRTAPCDCLVFVQHYYRAYYGGWKWFKVSLPLEPDGHFVGAGRYYAWRYTGAVRRRRKVEYHKASGTGGFRAWTGF